MTTELDPAVRVGTQLPGWLRWLLGAVLCIHGLIHFMGVALLLELGEPGALTYDVASPEPGTYLAFLFAIVWALAGAFFLLSGFQLVQHRSWSGLLVTASLTSLVAIGVMATAAPVGLVISSLTLAIGLWFTFRNPSRDSR